MKFFIKDGVLIKYVAVDEFETEVIVPNNVTVIDSYAFRHCKNLTTIIIPNGVTTIGSYTFEYCTSLTNIVIPNTVTSIGDGAFYFCKNLTSIIIPNGVTKISNSTFCGCYNLTNIVIPNSITKIEYYAFGCCKSLKTTTKNYKAFELIENKLICMDYYFEPNYWSEKEKNICLCERGYHYCTNLFDIFNHYWGRLDEQIAIYECEVGDEIIKSDDNSKCVTNKIKPIKRLYREDIIKILNSVESLFTFHTI